MTMSSGSRAFLEHHGVKVFSEEVIENSDPIDAFLSHFGVKGMKWGVRKKSGGVRVSADAKRVHSHQGKTASQLSNKQLKEINERLNLEQNYARLNPNKMQRGKRQVTEILSTIGIGVTMYNLATSPAGKAAIGAGKKAFGS